MSRSLVALLVVLGTLPQAAASVASQGEFVVTGDVLLPAGSEIVGPVHAWFASDTSELDYLALTTPKLKVEYHVRELVALARGDRVERNHQVYTYELTGATLSLAPGTAVGEMGLYPQSGNLAMTVMGAVSARPRVGHTYTTYEGETLTDARTRDARYRATVLNPHFDLTFDGVSIFEGAGSLIFFGPDLTIRARENSTVIRTGESEASDTVVWTVRQAWLALSFAEGHFEARGSEGAFRAAVASAAVSWRDMVVFEPLTGALKAGPLEYHSDGGPAYVSGEFEGALATRSLEGGHATLFRFGGELWSTNLAVASAAAPAPANDAPWSFLLAFVGLGGAGGMVGAVVLRRRRLAREAQPAPVASAAVNGSPEVCLAEANQAAEVEDWEAALAWIRKGRDLAPTSVKLRLDEAFFLSMLGRLPEAFRLYEEALTHTTDGEAAYSAAICAAQHARPAAEVERWLVAALERSPEFALEVAEECFREVLRRPLVREALEGAFERLRQGDDALDA